MPLLQFSPRRGQTKLIVMVALLIVLAGVATWLWMSPSTQPSQDAGRAVAEAFLTELREARPEKPGMPRPPNSRSYCQMLWTRL